jgi:hypothetical protein
MLDASSLSRNPSQEILNLPSNFYKVIKSYKAQKIGELDLDVGDTVQVEHSEGEYWTGIHRGWGENNGLSGIFPKNCIESMNAAEEASCDFNKFIVKASFNFVPTKTDELGLKVGDLIELLESPDGGWWKGKLKGGAEGWFPSSFVQMPNKRDLNGQPQNINFEGVSEDFIVPLRDRKVSESAIMLRLPAHENTGLTTSVSSDQIKNRAHSQNVLNDRNSLSSTISRVQVPTERLLVRQRMGSTDAASVRYGSSFNSIIGEYSDASSPGTIQTAINPSPISPSMTEDNLKAIAKYNASVAELLKTEIDYNRDLHFIIHV